MLTFANRPDLLGESRKDVGVQRHKMILVTQLFLSLQSRPDANMADFFRFENRREPPSLADRGSLRARKKSDILQCLGATTGRVAAAQPNNAAGMAHEQELATVAHQFPNRNGTAASWRMKTTKKSCSRLPAGRYARATYTEHSF